MFGLFKSKYTIDKFNEEMYQEQLKLTVHLESLMNELGYDDEYIYGGCGLGRVPCWMIIRSIGDQKYIDNYFEYTLRKVMSRNELEEGREVLSGTFQYLDPYFKQWAKTPDTEHQLANAILNAIGEGSEKKYGGIECMTVFAFFAEQFKYLLEKQQSLRKKIKQKTI